MKVALVFVLIFITLACLLVFGAFQPLPQKQQLSNSQLPRTATVAITADTTLSFVPDTTLLVGSTNSEFAVHMNTGRNSVNHVQLEIAYDPLMLKNVTITPGTFFPQPIIQYYENNQSIGRISFITNSSNNHTHIKGAGTVAILSFSRITSASSSATQTVIRIMPKSNVRFQGAPYSVLKQTTEATVFLGKE